ncbi:MAG: hypothetical protein B7Z72_02745 [Gemmatimonadetes bacterium 21-71-4]|nr:MAG: hypothetical protein B7Z72_02745 [Gemmatimonadetes bacterium 21-71-4]
MIAAWMLEATVAALLFALGAAAAQAVLWLYRGAPVRWAWVAAMAASLALPIAWFDAGAGSATARGSVPAGGATLPTAAGALPFHLPPVPAGVGLALLVAWGVASVAFALVLLHALWRLRAERRAWRTGVAGGVVVALSDTLGPAAVGVLRPRIVVPRWVLALDDDAQRAIVEHEREHQRARDPALLIAALAAVVVFPWNLGLWLGWRGLRRAIEFDCDERVLSGGVDRPQYARVLLGAWDRARTPWLPAPSLTRGSGLGARVEHLMRQTPRGRGMRTIVGIAMAAGLALAACETPAPQRVAGPITPVPSKAEARAPGSGQPLVFVDGVKQASIAVAPGDGATTGKGQLLRLFPAADEIASVEVLKGPAAAAKYGADGLNGVILITTKKAAAAEAKTGARR